MAKRKKPISYITFLLDRSGSMSSIKSQTIEGFNTYLAQLQAEEDADIRFTFLQFDTQSLDKLAVAKPVRDVRFLTNDSFQPRAGTPLIDAAYKTIKAVEEAVGTKKSRVVICIQTDGEENQSVDYTWSELSNLVKAKQEEGWQFNFLGAGIDAFKQAAQMGIAAISTMSYDNDAVATRHAFAASASNSAGFAAARLTSTGYSKGQRTAAGDKFFGKLTSKRK